MRRHPLWCLQCESKHEMNNNLYSSGFERTQTQFPTTIFLFSTNMIMLCSRLLKIQISAIYEFKIVENYYHIAENKDFVAEALIYWNNGS